MTQPEVKAKNQIKRELEKVLRERNLPSKLYWNGGQSVGLPRLDLDGVIAGHPFAVEVKRFDGEGKLSGRQKQDIAENIAAGAFSMVIDSPASLLVFLSWVHTLQPREPHPLPAVTQELK